MKWYKHLSGSLNDSFIFETIERFGGDGYLVFFGTLELMADEFDIYNPGKCTLSIKKLTKNLQISRQKLTKIYQFFDKIAEENWEKSKKNVALFATINKDHVKLNCPKLADLTDEYTSKLMSKISGQTPDNIRSESGFTPEQEVEVEEEVEEEVDVITSKEEDFTLPTKEELNEFSEPKIDECIDQTKEYIYRHLEWKKVDAWVNTKKKENRNKRAILHTLGRYVLRKPKGNAWGWCDETIKVEDGNYNERDHGKTS